jgi:hypothetical protein
LSEKSVAIRNTCSQLMLESHTEHSFLVTLLYYKPCATSNNTEVSICHKLQSYDITQEFEIHTNQPDFLRWYITITFTILDM